MTLRGGTNGALVRPSTSNLEAYELYLKARSLMKERGPSLIMAIELFERAVSLDPEFAPALAHLAQALILSSFWGMAPPDRVIARAKWAAATALEHHASLVAAYTASALVATCIDFDAARATEAWDRALAIDPGDMDARVLRAAFDLCYTRGAFDEAIAEVRAAIERDPLNAVAHTQLSVILSFAGRFDDAVVEANRAREIDAQSLFVVWAYVNALAFGGDAREVVALVPTLLPRYGRHPWLMMGLTAACGAARARGAGGVGVHGARGPVAERIRAAGGAGGYGGARGAARGGARISQAGGGDSRSAASAFALHSPPMGKLRAAPEFRGIIAGLGWKPSFPAAHPGPLHRLTRLLLRVRV